MSTDPASGFPTVPASSVPAVTADEMREVDRVATDVLGLGLIQMMENAGRHLAEVVVRRFAPRRTVVLAGTGGNGGGGLVAARHLATRGGEVLVVLSDAEGLDDVPRRQLAILERSDAAIATDPGPGDVVIDALLGYALDGDPRGRPAELIRWANDQAAPVCSLDLPSGLAASTGRVGDPCVRAAATLTLALPKTGLARAPEVVGELFLADLGIPRPAFDHVGGRPETVFARGSILRLV